ncbi:hypothetical protein O3G_MSEX002806 [Manduca sexta]|uniref:Uncharacterized protein n=1 Tax=Manduca sexta TaxID=7130 RepID=A0A921YPY1_MANSE|nr:hypothetical protein O3G_MSEX002806 [Manduca sexta]KAG6443258.1 hypothetical protein O3G_MSEX002806 [Manduca sexta]
MTSPAINKSPASQKNEKKSPTHSVNNEVRNPTENNGAATVAPQQQPELFGWLRIFRLADLMVKQGC